MQTEGLTLKQNVLGRVFDPRDPNQVRNSKQTSTGSSPKMDPCSVSDWTNLANGCYLRAKIQNRATANHRHYTEAIKVVTCHIETARVFVCSLIG